MSILMAGIDHNTAEIDIRTVFSFTKKQTADALQKLKQVDGIAGCVLLSTCNRMELWLSTEDAFQGDIYGLLCEIREVPSEEYKNYFRLREGRTAVRHLFRLAGGLESRILGEDQIVTQVNEALLFAREQYAADHVLETLFRQAVTVGKKVKTDIVLSASDQSAVHAAIRTMQQDGFDFQEKTCMVIGNGIMGKLAANQLRSLGADVTVTVRQYHRGVVEIPDKCHRIDYGNRMELFGDCDFVVSATVSPNYTLTKEVVCQYLRKPVVLVDLAVPRDIEASIKELENVKLYDIDDFRNDAENDAQKEAIKQAELYFEEQMDEFFSWYEYVDIIPKIQEIKEKAALDLKLRLSKKLRNLPLEDALKEQLGEDIENAAARTMNKLLFGLKDGVNRKAFREAIGCLENIYRE